MRITLIRHGMTEGNRHRRYIGVTDEPLSHKGFQQLAQVHFPPCHTVYVTPLRRTGETAALLFPDAQQIVVPDLQEMDFGRFENRSAQDMEQDADYRAWVDGGCLAPCPGGESRPAFSQRVCAAFEALVLEALDKQTEQAVFVLHGGSIMAILERFCDAGQDFYSYHLQNGQAYLCHAARGDHGLILSQLQKNDPA